MNLQEHIPLAPLTTMGVGGEARFFVEVRSLAEIAEALEFAREQSVPVQVLGGGSNVVIADTGFEGLVLLVRLQGVTFEQNGDDVSVTASAGVVWDELVAETITRGYAGFECLSGVPGTVGGAVVANIGCYGVQCSDTLMRVEAIDTTDATCALRVFEKEECLFSYHDSVFAKESGRYIVIRATFLLRAGKASRPAYEDYRFNLAKQIPADRELTLAAVRAALLDTREQKGALILPGRLSYKSVGSFFHMPYVSAQQYEHIAATARELDTEKEEHLRPWAWEQSDGSYKLAPGFLLEYTEFQKGYVRGSVGISPKHTLSIINVADARACDIAELASEMQNAVEKIFGIRLEREVAYIGDVEQ